MVKVFSFSAGLVLATALYGGPPPPGSLGDRMLGLIRPLIGLGEKPTPVLRYFDARGRGEVIRLALVDTGVNFTDASFSAEQWGKDRTDGLKWQWLDEGLLPFSQVPLLEFGNFRIVQSHTILRFLGRAYGWYLGPPDELAAIDLVADGVEDARKRLSDIKYSGLPPEQMKQKYEEYYTDFADGAPRWLGFFDRIVRRSGSNWVAGTRKPTHADYLLFDLLDAHELQAPSAEHAASLFTVRKLPNLLAWRERMRERPGLKSYLAGPNRREK